MMSDLSTPRYLFENISTKKSTKCNTLRGCCESGIENDIEIMKEEYSSEKIIKIHFTHM